MEAYDYVKSETQDIIEYIKDNIDLNEFKDMDDNKFSDYLQDQLWTEDSVTGNGSGSYFCNADKARECLCGNEDLINEVYQDLCDSSQLLRDITSPETIDCNIRCYILRKCIDKAVRQIDRPTDDDDYEEEDDNE